MPQIRLTGGEFRGRLIHTPDSDRTRPTQARLRQALLNTLQMEVGDARVLDLFSGSGALAFESLSRGAMHAVCVERDRKALTLIHRNIAELGLKSSCTVLADVLDKKAENLTRWGNNLAQTHGPFQIILADPPYEDGWELRLLQNLPWAELLSPGGIFCLEWGVQKSQVSELPDSVPGLQKEREKSYGDSMLTSYRRA